MTAALRFLVTVDVAPVEAMFASEKLDLVAGYKEWIEERLADADVEVRYDGRTA